MLAPVALLIDYTALAVQPALTAASRRGGVYRSIIFRWKAVLYIHARFLAVHEAAVFRPIPVRLFIVRNTLRLFIVLLPAATPRPFRPGFLRLRFILHSTFLHTGFVRGITGLIVPASLLSVSGKKVLHVFQSVLIICVLHTVVLL
jgi:hypothetical protein